MIKVLYQTARSVEIPQSPAFAAQNYVGFLKFAELLRLHCFQQTYDLERHLLLSRPADLLPFHRNEKCPPIFLGNCVDVVLSKTKRFPSGT
jgi:hypothetical protein